MFPVYSQNNVKKKKKKKWFLEGNKNIDSTKHFIGTKDLNPLIFKTNSTERMRITSGGYIGIGTPAPTFPVEINTTARIKNITTDYIYISKGLVVGDLHFCRGNSCTVDTVHTTQQRDLLLRSGNLLGLIADTVRIANPVGASAQLKVAGSISASDVYISGLQSGKFLMVDKQGKIVPANFSFIQAKPAPPSACPKKHSPFVASWKQPVLSQLYSDSNAVIKYPIEGAVGIGTCRPFAKLSVVNTDNLNYSFTVRSSNYSYDFIVNKYGQVGIGTTNIPSGFTMAVCGKIKSQEILVEPPGWCDYVFEDDYNLMPWKDVVTYYRTHKHLPGVPSEKEVENAGVPVGEMTKILLQKIEELHLYIEKLEKRI